MVSMLFFYKVITNLPTMDVIEGFNFGWKELPDWLKNISYRIEKITKYVLVRLMSKKYKSS